MNKAIISGRTVKELELRKTTNGKSMLNFVLAVARDKDNTDFISCVAWDKRAELIHRYVRKGQKIGIIGRIQTRKYGDRDGRTNYVTEIVCDEVEFMDKPSEAQKPSVTHETKTDYKDIEDISADELPF